MSSRMGDRLLAIATDPRNTLISYPFQLRPDLWVYLDLPPVLRRADVDQINALLRTLVWEAE